MLEAKHDLGFLQISTALRHRLRLHMLDDKEAFVVVHLPRFEHLAEGAKSPLPF